MASSEVDVFAENYTLIDWDVHELWIKGLSVTEAVIVMRERGILTEYPGVTQDLLVSDLNDHYRLFAMLENMLLTAGRFSDQSLYQMAPETQHLLVERYYGLDNALCRDLLGKKLSSRLRKDLDELAEKTGVHLKSCRRQFDNIKRIFKTIEDMPGRYVPNIQRTFYLSRALAEKYAVLVLLGSFRFEMNKKKLNSLSFDMIKSVCLTIMDHLMDYEDDNEPNLDKDFLVSLKELKVLLEKDKEHRSLVCARMELETTFTARSYSEVENNFKLLTRNVLSLAQSLSSSKDLKDFFLYLVEKLVEPMRQMRLDRAEVELFLLAYSSTAVANLLPDESSRTILKRYMAAVTASVLAIY